MGREVRPHHAVTISTDPAGAGCLVTGGAEPITELQTTPAVVRLPQSPRDVRVFCTAPGHAPVVATLPAEPDAEPDAKQVASAALLFGAAPAAAGVMMGAGYSHAPKLNVTLLPVRFATTRTATGSSPAVRTKAGATSINLYGAKVDVPPRRVRLPAHDRRHEARQGRRAGADREAAGGDAALRVNGAVGSGAPAADRPPRSQSATASAARITRRKLPAHSISISRGP